MQGLSRSRRVHVWSKGRLRLFEVRVLHVQALSWLEAHGPSLLNSNISADQSTKTPNLND